MRATEFITEAKVPPVRDQIIADVKKNGPGEYFVRVTDVDRLGFSARQKFGRSPDMDDPDFDVDYIGAGKGRPALWFYPLGEYLKHTDLYATESPYVWLVKLKDTAWLQPARRGASGVSNPPEGKERVGIMRYSNPPAAIFFQPGFDIVGRYYDYAGQHQRHGLVKGAPKPTFFDRVRGVNEAFDQPYPVKWEKSEHGDYDALATLGDGTHLNIMFEHTTPYEVNVSFWRNNSLDVTGEGDAQRVFATVLTAIQEFLKIEQPANISFSASKEVEPGQNSESRAKLYNRLVQRYAGSWGYTTNSFDHGDEVVYELSRKSQPVAEGLEHYNGIEISLEKEDDEIMVTARLPSGRELGHVLFVQEGDYLMPQDLEVEERYQGQGIAATMYDYVKSKGYKIRRSGQQTDAGAGFWDKHRPKQNVWEQGVAETINTDILNKRFRHKQVIGDYTYTASVEIFLDEPLLYIKAYDGDKEIGHAMFEVWHFKDQPTRSHIESGGTEVDPKYRNKGIASTMYAYAKMLGNDINASPNRTPQGKAMWAAWEKSGDAKHITRPVGENFDDGKNPGRKGLSRRVGIPKKATLAQLEKIAGSSTGERRRMAQWQLNMRRGKKK
jgi:GNAT superfamily N-acetyltransferase